jgi:hypothetical protein
VGGWLDVHAAASDIGVNAGCASREIVLDPVLPHWLSDLALQNLGVGGRRLDIRFRREGHDTKFDVLDGDPEAIERCKFGAQFDQFRPA